jgi:glucokinase
VTGARRLAGVDVGGTKCLGVVVEHDEVVADVRLPTPSGHAAIADAIAEVASQLAPYDSLGVGVPGLVTRAGVLRAAPNLSAVAEFDVAGMVAARVGGDVAVDNDATCATVAEWRLGAGRGSDHVVLVTLGTGIGGGIVASGRLLRGHNGFAGEFGHLVVDPTGPPCVCGRRGCWERYASGAGLARLARDVAEVGQARRVLELAGGDPERVRGEHVQQAAREGDPEALGVVDAFGRWVALGLVNLTNALDPERFVLGGGLAAGADLYLEPIERWFGHLLYSPDLRPHPHVAFARFGEHAGAVGAALLPTLD